MRARNFGLVLIVGSLALMSSAALVGMLCASANQIGLCYDWQPAFKTLMVAPLGIFLVGIFIRARNAERSDDEQPRERR